MSRKLSNWLETYNEYVIPETESPLSFIRWSGLFCISSTLRRNVSIPRKLMGKYDIHPNLYALFIAPPGRARKSTVLNVAEHLLEPLAPYVNLAPTATTKEKFISILANANNLDSSMSIISGEFSSLIHKSGIEMYEILTDLFDSKRKFSVELLSRDAEIAEKPCVNLLAASTPGWIAENMPESVIGGGFASRVIFIYEEKVRRHKLFFDDVDSDKQEALGEDLVHDLKHIAETLEGEYELDKQARQYAMDWYIKSQEEFEKGGGGKLDGYKQRRHLHMLKVAMIIAAAQRDELVLKEADLKKSVEYLGEIEQSMEHTFDLVGKNKHMGDMIDIVNFIKNNGRVEKREIVKRFARVGFSDLLGEILSTAVDCGDITTEIKNGKVYYKG